MDKRDFSIIQGKTFEQIIRWETEPFIYKAISAIARTAPVRITAAGHGLTDGWRVAVASVRGMTELNTTNTPPQDDDFRRCTVVDADTIEFNEVNASEFAAYASGGYLQFYTPMSLAGCTARMTIKNKAGGAALLSLTTENGRIALNDVAKTITLLIEDEDTSAMTTNGVYDLELEDADGKVYGICFGAIKVTKEITA